MKIQTTAEIVQVTPETAAEWLSNRWGEQRGVRANHVERLAADMEAGRFRISPDAILRIKGKLANGQHRLQAVIKTGKCQSFLVMESNDDELYKVIDAGLRRSVSDGLIGVPYARAIPAIARWVQSYEKQNLYHAARSPSEASAGSCHVYSTQAEMIEYCLSNVAALSEAAAFVGTLYEQTLLLQSSIGGALYVIAHSHNKGEEVKAFLTQVYVEGGPTSAGDLRNRLIANRGSKSKIKAGYIFGITLKAFKAFCQGKRAGVLKWAKDEEFPLL